MGKILSLSLSIFYQSCSLPSIVVRETNDDDRYHARITEHERNRIKRSKEENKKELTVLDGLARFQIGVLKNLIKIRKSHLRQKKSLGYFFKSCTF